MHGHTNIKFTSAKQAKRNSTISEHQNKTVQNYYSYTV